MSDKMNVKDFCAKLDNEGVAYAFLDYGLTHNDLDAEEDPDFYELVKSLTYKFDYMREDIKNLEKYISDNLEEM